MPGKEDMELAMDLGRLRREVGLSVKQVVIASGIDKSTYERMERGEGPTLVNALRLARYLRTPVEEIWRLKE